MSFWESLHVSEMQATCWDPKRQVVINRLKSEHCGIHLLWIADYKLPEWPDEAYKQAGGLGKSYRYTNCNTQNIKPCKYLKLCITCLMLFSLKHALINEKRPQMGKEQKVAFPHPLKRGRVFTHKLRHWKHPFCQALLNHLPKMKWKNNIPAQSPTWT